MRLFFFLFLCFTLSIQIPFAQTVALSSVPVPNYRTQRTDTSVPPSKEILTRIMTFNLRYDNSQDGENAWDKRKYELLKTIRAEQCDFYCFQEALYSQVNYLADSLGLDYTYYGKGRDDAKQGGEYSPIFFDKNRYILMNAHTYWLSSTPDTVSRGWDAACNRIVTAVYFYDTKVDRYLTVFNTHFDHIGVVARKHSAEFILSLLDRKPWIESSQTIVCGDFNALSSDESIQLLQDRLTIAQEKNGQEMATFNAFDTSRAPEKRIDFILFANFKKGSIHTMQTHRANGLWLSDHLPVVGILEEEQ